MSKKYLQHFVVVVAFSGAASAQAILEHAAGAAGGSVAGIAGKKISDGISAVMGNTAVDTQQDEIVPAADPTRLPGGEAPGGLKRLEPERKPNRAPAPPPTPPLASASVAAAPPAVQRSREIPITPAYALSNWTKGTLSLPVATVASLSSVTPGTSIEELGNSLGLPAARVVIPGNDGHVLQLIRYRDHIGLLGVIHAEDGKVSSVEVR